MKITTRPYGVNLDGKAVTEYTLSNAQGASVSILDFGGTITKLFVPDREGKLADVVLGFDDVAPYTGSAGSMGAIIGRFGNRIAGATFDLDGKTYSLAKNDGDNSLHGGTIGYNKRMWAVKTASDEHSAKLIMTLDDPDMYEGFPGAVRLSVTYTFDDENKLSIVYHATTDKPTIINLTNHSYFNLDGHDSGCVCQQTLQVNADYVTKADVHLIPTGELIPQTQVAYDFSKPTLLKTVLDKTPDVKEMKDAGGVDFNYCAGRDRERKLIATLASPKTGRVMDVYTDEPGVQIYTGNGLHFTGKGGASYKQFGGVCLETQHYPDSIHQPHFPSVVLRPCDVYHTETIYAFSVK